MQADYVYPHHPLSGVFSFGADSPYEFSCWIDQSVVLEVAECAVVLFPLGRAPRDGGSGPSMRYPMALDGAWTNYYRVCAADYRHQSGLEYLDYRYEVTRRRGDRRVVTEETAWLEAQVPYAGSAHHVACATRESNAGAWELLSSGNPRPLGGGRYRVPYRDGVEEGSASMMLCDKSLMGFRIRSYAPLLGGQGARTAEATYVELRNLRVRLSDFYREIRVSAKVGSAVVYPSDVEVELQRGSLPGPVRLPCERGLTLGVRLSVPAGVDVMSHDLWGEEGARNLGEISFETRTLGGGVASEVPDWIPVFLHRVPVTATPVIV